MGVRHVTEDGATDRSAAMLGAARRSSLLGALGRTDLEAVLARCHVRHARRDERLLRASDDATLFLLRGAALVSTTTTRGHTAVLAVLDQGAAWGLASGHGQRHGAIEVTALAECAGLTIPGADLRELLATHPAIAQATLDVVATELAETRDEIARFAHTSATERVIVRLMELSERWGRRIDGTIQVGLPLTQDLLASWARTSRESAAKVLHDLRSSGIIRTGRRELVILDPHRLAGRLEPGTGQDAAVRELLRSVI